MSDSANKRRLRSSLTEERKMSMSPTPTGLSPSTKKRRAKRNIGRTEKIKEAINTLEPKIKSRDLTKMIKSVCPSPSQCLVLSAEYIPHFHNLFSGFSDFSMLSANHPRQFINLSAGVNGFVNELYYSDKTNTYTTSAIIKSGYTTVKDKVIENVTYEGLVGMFFINEEMYKFPCFIETYGICKYKPNTNLKRLFYENNENNYKIISPELVNSSIMPLFTPTIAHNMIKNKTSIKRTLYNSKAIRYAMNDSKDTAIISQHIPDADNLYDHFVRLLFLQDKEKYESYFIFSLNFELLTLLFQIYSVLSHLSEKYTHNDLHYKNTLIYSLGSKYIKMVYHMGGDGDKKVEFYTNKIMKIIDYGRNYVNGEHFSSTCFYKSVCKMEKMEESLLRSDSSLATAATAAPTTKNDAIDLGCDPDEPTTLYETDGELCGKKYGINGFWGIPTNSKDEYTSVLKRNRSADILLIHRLHELLLDYIYKNEYISNIDLPDIFNYLELRVYNLFSEVYSQYRKPLILKTIHKLNTMLESIEECLLKNNHPDIDKYIKLDKPENFTKLLQIYRSPEIMQFLYNNDMKLYNKFVSFNKLALKPEYAATAFYEFKNAIEKLNPAHAEYTSHRILANLKFNFYINNHMSSYIAEYEPSHLLNTVNGISSYLELKLKELKILKATYNYFENMNNSYEYIGELHVYLDGSGKNSHFIAATSSNV